MTNNVNYDASVREMIIANLDGWHVTEVLDEPVEVTENETGSNNTNNTETSSDVNPFMSSTEVQNKYNKTITDNECRLFYEEALDQSYIYTNRLNIDDLNTIEAKMFIRGVCKWAASNLWNKYNIRVNNEDMEDTYVQSYGGLLYKSALKILQNFINQRIYSSSSLSDEDIYIWR